jgi:hypothetical protein
VIFDLFLGKCSLFSSSCVFATWQLVRNLPTQLLQQLEKVFFILIFYFLYNLFFSLFGDGCAMLYEKGLSVNKLNGLSPNFSFKYHQHK